MAYNVICSRCNGTGRYDRGTCFSCKGAGSKQQAVKVRRDIATVVSGLRHDGSAEYAFERDPEGMERTYKFDGVRWREIRRNAETGRWIIIDNTSLRIGSRSEYYDPSF